MADEQTTQSESEGLDAVQESLSALSGDGTPADAETSAEETTTPEAEAPVAEEKEAAPEAPADPFAGDGWLKHAAERMGISSERYSVLVKALGADAAREIVEKGGKTHDEVSALYGRMGQQQQAAQQPPVPGTPSPQMQAPANPYAFLDTTFDLPKKAGDIEFDDPTYNALHKPVADALNQQRTALKYAVEQVQTMSQTLNEYATREYWKDVDGFFDGLSKDFGQYGKGQTRAMAPQSPEGQKRSAVIVKAQEIYTGSQGRIDFRSALDEAHYLVNRDTLNKRAEQQGLEKLRERKKQVGAPPPRTKGAPAPQTKREMEDELKEKLAAL